MLVDLKINSGIFLKSLEDLVFLLILISTDFILKPLLPAWINVSIVWENCVIILSLWQVSRENALNPEVASLILVFEIRLLIPESVVYDNSSKHLWFVSKSHNRLYNEPYLFIITWDVWELTPGIWLNLISPIRRGLCHMHGKGFVNGDIVVEADLLAQIAKK